MGRSWRSRSLRFSDYWALTNLSKARDYTPLAFLYSSYSLFSYFNYASRSLFIFYKSVRLALNFSCIPLSVCLSIESIYLSTCNYLFFLAKSFIAASSSFEVFSAKTFFWFSIFRFSFSSYGILLDSTNFWFDSIRVEIFWR